MTDYAEHEAKLRDAVEGSIHNPALDDLLTFVRLRAGYEAEPCEAMCFEGVNPNWPCCKRRVALDALMKEAP